MICGILRQACLVGVIRLLYATPYTICGLVSLCGMSFTVGIPRPRSILNMYVLQITVMMECIVLMNTRRPFIRTTRDL
jgi:hypothetical protein